GQWFLTPDNEQKSRLYDRLVSDPEGTAELMLLLAEQRIDYLVMPAENAAAIAAALGDRVRERKTFGRLELLVLGP
ncbi:MAG: hypothetical protein GY769_21590, partial [bacterium]|nr:hypothetical protein [bacterium]